MTYKYFRRLPNVALITFVGAACISLFYPASPASAQTNFCPANPFAVLAATTVTNTGPTVISGNLGVSPGTAVIGFPPGTVNGTIHAGPLSAATQGQVDAQATYNTLAAQPCTAILTGTDLGGLTLAPGVYCFASSAFLTGTLTLNALGSPNAPFIFKVGSTLITSSGSSVVLINGASTCNVNWAVGSSTTLGTGTQFVGNIYSLASNTLTTGATVAGSVIALTGAVTLDSKVEGVPSYTAEELHIAEPVKAVGPTLFGEVAVRSGALKARSFRNTPADIPGMARRVINDLGLLEGGDHLTANGINDPGDVVGSANTRTSLRAFLSLRNTGVLDLGTLPGDSASEAFGINNRRWVVGYSTGPAGTRAFLWTTQDGMQNLGTLPGGNASKAFAISDNGAVVGSSTSPLGTRAVIWDNRGIQDLGVLPGDFSSEAFGINNRGTVVGYSLGPLGVRAFAWTSQGGMQTLEGLPGSQVTRALAINDSGDVIGSSRVSQITRAVLWSKGGEPQDLNLLTSLPFGVRLLQALGINARGEIVALGKDEVSQDQHVDLEGFSRRVFLLTP